VRENTVLDPRLPEAHLHLSYLVWFVRYTRTLNISLRY
jgi:hypothetical protein